MYVRLMRAGFSICDGVAAKDVSALKMLRYLRSTNIKFV